MSQFKATGRTDGEQGREDPPHPKATRQENFLLLGGGQPSVLFFLLIDEVHPPEEPSAYSKDSNVNLSKHTPAQERSEQGLTGYLGPRGPVTLTQSKPSPPVHTRQKGSQGSSRGPVPRVLGPPLNHRRPWQSPGPRDARADFLSGPKSPLRRAGIPARERRGCRPPHGGPVPPAEGTAARPLAPSRVPSVGSAGTRSCPTSRPTRRVLGPPSCIRSEAPTGWASGACADLLAVQPSWRPEGLSRPTMTTERSKHSPLPPRDRGGGGSRTLQSSSLAMELSPRRCTGSTPAPSAGARAPAEAAAGRALRAPPRPAR